MIGKYIQETLSKNNINCRMTTLVIMLIMVCTMASCKVDSVPLPSGNLLINPDFEQGVEGLPKDWVFEDRVRHMGKVSVDGNKSKNRVLRLLPNKKNVPSKGSQAHLGIGQVLDLNKYPDLRGKTLYIEAKMGAVGQASARLRVTGIRSGGEFIGISLDQAESKGELIEHSDVLSIPDDNRTRFVIIGLDIQGTSGEAVFGDVYIGTVPRPGDVASANDGKKVSKARIQIDATNIVRKIPETLYGTNIEWIWDGNGLWDADAKELNKDIVRLTRKLKPTLIRYPGGLFSDFYHWRDGIGPHAKRPTTEHFPEGPKSRHNLGTDEALEFARRVGSELMITVNISTGTPEEAVEWLRYINRPGKTKGQKPKVKYWEIGNENYYYDYFKNTPYLEKSAHNPEEYAKRFLAFARALKKADPRIRVIAIAEDDYESDFEPIHPTWIKHLLSTAGHVIDYIAIHNGYAPKLQRDEGFDLRTVYRGMLAAPIRMKQSLDRVTEQKNKYAPKHAKHIKLAITEWAPLFQYDQKSRFIDHTKSLGSALLVASSLKNYIEHPDVGIANYFKLSGRLSQGMIGPRNGKFIPKATYHAFRMYREHFGPNLIKTRAESDTYSSVTVGSIKALKKTPYLDVVSSLSKDGKRLYVMVVNKHFDQAIAADIELTGFKAKTTGRTFVLSGSGIDANTGTQLFKAPGITWTPQADDKKNPRFGHGAPGEISITEKPIKGTAGSFQYSFAPHSVTAIELDVAN